MKKYKKLIETLYQQKIYYKLNEPLCKHTSIKIGGNAKVFVEVEKEKQLISLIKFLDINDIKYHFLGAGTNTLAKDGNIDAVVISLKKLNRYKISNTSVYFQCGVNLFFVNKICKDNCLAGLEFTYGIPGSVGGTIYMNAGANGNSVGDFVEYVKVLKDGKIRKYKKEEMMFSYRNSIAQDANFLILGAKFKLKYGDKSAIEKLQKEYFNLRLKNQPYDKLSFGSVFKRNQNFEPVSKLIDKLGLKGYRVGDAMISEKHAGFIINIGSATCQDCLLLIKYIQDLFFQNFGFIPELEVKLLE